MPFSLPYSWRRDRYHDGVKPPDEVEASFQATGDPRCLEEKDRDKILYNPFLRRLGGVSQVIPSGLDQRIHNRLTHSLEVSQLSRRLAKLELEHNSAIAKELHLAPDIAEAAGLAHDLGHPPFGHVGEEALDKLLRSYKHPLIDNGNPHFVGGFEGNAQTFRVLGVLSVANNPIAGEGVLRGMNLTRATYASVIKYPWAREAGDPEGQKFNIYRQKGDMEVFQWVMGDVKEMFRTPECEIMDYADDVIYSILDVCDFVRRARINLRKHESPEYFKQFVIQSTKVAGSPLYGQEAEKLNWELLEEARITLFFGAPDGHRASPNSETELNRWMVSIMDRLTLRYADKQYPFRLTNYERTEFKTKQVYRCARIDERAAVELSLLKSLTWVYVINSDFELAIIKRVADSVLKKLVWYFDQVINDYLGGRHHHQTILIPYLHLIENLDGSRLEQIRLACDIVASLTDQEAANYYEKLMLHNFG